VELSTNRLFLAGSENLLMLHLSIFVCMNVIGIIPSRYGSSRFPGKPLVDIMGKSMIQRVYEQAVKANKLQAVYVATDDERIKKHVENFGGKVVMTAGHHPSGTDRCREAIEKINLPCDVIINIQGDEPFIQPEQINNLAQCFVDEQVHIATLIRPVNDIEPIRNDNRIKVVIDKNHFALYFSRSVIPYVKNIDTAGENQTLKFYQHIGLYAYRHHILTQITQLKPSMLEQAESLEQLRWLENGYRIKTIFTEHESYSVDTPQDLQLLKTLFGNQ
jgi:3-deoxy-manno-octulosonate cytidylyltransferase (CMP-KDO synthetase)